MTLRVYTAHRSYAGADRLDVTIKEQDPVGRVFAPAPEDFRTYSTLKKAGLLTLEAWETYAKAYRAHMARSASDRADEWARLLARSEVTLVCFCVEPSFCHRRLLGEILREKGAVVLGERPKTRRGDAAE